MEYEQGLRGRSKTNHKELQRDKYKWTRMLIKKEKEKERKRRKEKCNVKK
jgi:hypothetical protein